MFIVRDRFLYCLSYRIEQNVPHFAQFVRLKQKIAFAL
jgi:hypothetical protein